MEILRFSIAALLIVVGLFVLVVATLGLFRLRYVLNRVHASAKCETLGTMLVLLGLCVLLGFTFTSLKLGALIIFLWLTTPVALFMVARAEVQTNPRLHEEVDTLVVSQQKETLQEGEK
ncbi:MAG: monovalent cation/H(+) antiporter subunit G [Spirochaetaceae bacterium]|nr:monovalent cation/H(+) antiporter subunit G [Spirochaetaceae bacterium]